ncbi:GNAT family N-acetyltransferase [Roseovarius pelagicus]|uniref:GNAT family N-acetyltransferase n=1 Tax=Roseovarius pelagicus TaxID=2980108 RepID=A0ABY6DFU6_9RHOB|nr:GNAT family N-acetyltransferase [Roseovarius pelagicus]UXX84078.1 GNAT family N-acetyltransferase [Roseovarius pelagicus]
MIIRPAEARDIAQIIDIWNPVIRDTAATFTTEEKTPAGLATTMADRETAGHAFLVATDAAQVLGFATCFPFRGGPGYVRTLEHSVILAPQARGQGCGRALVFALQDAALGAGARHLIAGVSGENLGAVEFHKAIGFRQVGVLPGVGYKFGRWMDLILLQKTLVDLPDNPHETG